MESSESERSIQSILLRLKAQDLRLERIERQLNIQNSERTEWEDEQQSKTVLETIDSIDQDEVLEYRIGQFWFAKAGILAFVVGIMFMLTLPHEDLPRLLPAAAGIVLSFCFLLIPQFMKSIHPQLSGYLTGSGLLLLFFTAFRIHFLEKDPLLENTLFAIIILNVVFITALLISLRKQSVYLTGLSILLGYLTALLGGNPYYIFTWIIVIAAISVYIKIKYRWETFFALSIYLAYLTHFIWFINNPLLGHDLTFLTEPELNVIFPFIYFLIFISAYIIKRDEPGEPFIKIANITGNAVLFFLLLFALTLSDKDHSIPGILFTAASIIYLSYSTWFWLKEESRYITFILAMTGYLALSTAIFYGVGIPKAFIYLCWQSIIVIYTAVWYKSRFIITANFFIYILIIIAYLFLADGFSIISLSFGVAALLSARILKWKQDTLELKTDHMRNSYLIIALLYFPFILYMVMPAGFVPISWVCVALVYYILSLVLENRKYRWMAVLTLLMSIFYVSILGLTSSQLIYKIISFLVLGTVLIAVSVLYGRRRKNETISNAGNK